MKNFNYRTTNYTSFSNTSRDEGLRQYFLKIYTLMSSGLLITAIAAFAVFSVPALTNLMFNITPDGYLMGMTGIGWVVTFTPLGIALYFSLGFDRINAQTLATRMCEVVKDQIVITSDIKKDYEKENRNTFINKEHIRTLNSTEEQFLINLMNYVETIWNNSDFTVVDFSKPLKYSKSQVYRKMISLTGKPPSNFIRDFRLNRAIHLLHYRKGNITEIASQTGFKNGSYFSKCFKDKFQITPSKYLQQHT